jgi:hypothetical protein
MSVDVSDDTVQDGTLETVLAGMDSYLTDEDLQSNGCSALRIIAWDKHNAEYLVLKLGRLGAVTSAMKQFAENVTLQKWGCWLLNNTTQWEGSRI